MRRLGDNGQLVLLQLIGADESLTKKSKPKKRSRKKQKETAEVTENTNISETTETSNEPSHTEES
jgi:hypothetical protein